MRVENKKFISFILVFVSIFSNIQVSAKRDNRISSLDEDNEEDQESEHAGDDQQTNKCSGLLGNVVSFFGGAVLPSTLFLIYYKYYWKLDWQYIQEDILSETKDIEIGYSNIVNIVGNIIGAVSTFTYTLNRAPKNVVHAVIEGFFGEFKFGEKIKKDNFGEENIKLFAQYLFMFYLCYDYDLEKLDVNFKNRFKEKLKDNGLEGYISKFTNLDEFCKYRDENILSQFYDLNLKKEE